jgi:hypothetical protein
MRETPLISVMEYNSQPFFLLGKNYFLGPKTVALYCTSLGSVPI